jgi:hypothetical protein
MTPPPDRGALAVALGNRVAAHCAYPAPAVIDLDAALFEGGQLTLGDLALDSLETAEAVVLLEEELSVSLFELESDVEEWRVRDLVDAIFTTGDQDTVTRFSRRWR